MLLWKMWQIFFTFWKTGGCGKMIRRLMENAKGFGTKHQGVLKKCLDVFLKHQGAFCRYSFFFQKLKPA